MTRKEKIRLLRLKKEKLRRRAQTEYPAFCQYIDPDFSLKEDFHKTYYKILDLWASGKVKNLMISVPSQHGKSEGSTRKLPAFVFGKNPNAMIGIASYSGGFAEQFNVVNQQNIDNDRYRDIFPRTLLGDGKRNSVKRTSIRFDIVGHRGFLKAVGRGGALTGDPIDYMIMDDLYSSELEGNSPTIREKVVTWYTSVVRKRLHNNSQQLMVFTRWHDDDLIGYVEKREPTIIAKCWDDFENVPDGTWVKVNFQALKDEDKTELDPRERGEALWPDKHNAAKHNRDKDFDPVNFEKMSQGNPCPAEGFLYDINNWPTYDVLPKMRRKKRMNYTDTADTGKDYLSSICYIEFENKAYVEDVYYTDEAMEVTEKGVAKMLDLNKTNVSNIESNNGGRGFARAVEKETTAGTAIKWFYQGANKESRILTNSVAVNKNIVFPSDWKEQWPEFYQHVKMYLKDFKANVHDDAPDCLTGIIEKMSRSKSLLDVINAKTKRESK